MKTNITLVAFFLAVCASGSQASPILVQVNPGGKIQIDLMYNDDRPGTNIWTTDNGPGDQSPIAGVFLFTPPDQAKLSTVEIKNFGALTPNVRATVHFDFALLGPDPFVPMLFPEIGAIDHALVTSIDVPTFAGTAAFFPTTGSILVTNGIIDGFPGLRILDATSLYPNLDAFFDVNVPLTPAVLAALPVFTGTGQVVSGVSIVPIPSALWLFGSALAGIYTISRRKQTKRLGFSA